MKKEAFSVDEMVYTAYVASYTQKLYLVQCTLTNGSKIMIAHNPKEAVTRYIKQISDLKVPVQIIRRMLAPKARYTATTLELAQIGNDNIFVMTNKVNKYSLVQGNRV